MKYRQLILSIISLQSFCLTILISGLLVISSQAYADDKMSTEQIKNLTEKVIQTMVWVDGGTFNMGSNDKDARKREKPVHEVSLDGFYIAKYELTQDIFEQVMGWNYSYFPCSNCPINNISWLNIQAFITKLNKITDKTFRLPTEAEWAFAARGGNKSKQYIFSGANNIDDVAWYNENSNNRSHPVGLKKPNELGLHDMTGNLWEFCLDDMSRKAYSLTEKHNPFWGDSTDETATNPPSTTKLKVLRGSGYEFAANESKVFFRDGATSNVRMADIGFRLAMSKQ